MKFCFHSWSKWSDPFDTAYDHTKVQARYCTECNLCQVKKIKQPWNIWFSAKFIQKISEHK